MAVTEKVEIGFDLLGSSTFFKLDDPIQGKLDNISYTLGGTVFYDVTPYVKNYSIRRGKSRQLDVFNAAIATITFDNRDRRFDPTYTASPYYTQIVPKREIRITSNGVRQYTGLVDDWNFDYSVTGESTAMISASDGFSRLANQTFNAGTAITQLSGARVSAVLDATDVNWPVSLRSIGTGTVSLGTDVYPTDGNVLEYLQRVEKTERGYLYVNKTGNLTFKDATQLVPNSSSFVELSDNGTGIPYAAMQVVYGSELLYNQVVAASVSAAGTVTADALTSQSLFGVQTITALDLLMSSPSAVSDWALQTVNYYSAPEYRFEAITVNLDTLDAGQVSQILNLEIGSLCKITFTPNGIAPAISKYARVIAIADNVNTVRHAVTLGFSTLDTIPFILDDAVFGKLDTANVG